MLTAIITLEVKFIHVQMWNYNYSQTGTRSATIVILVVVKGPCMCGRFSLSVSAEQIGVEFNLKDLPDFHPSYNIAPSQKILAIRQNDTGNKEAVLLRWGLVPPWMPEEKISSKYINARGETVATQPMFRSAFKKRHCLIVADGFYEWQATDAGKQAYYIYKQNHEPFAFAGLWESWTGGHNKSIESCTIITTTANKLLSSIHSRMPVIVRQDDFQDWLLVKENDKDCLEAYNDPSFMAYPVSSFVNNPRHNSIECLKRID